MSEHIVFTDGGCIGQVQKVNPQAGFGIYIRNSIDELNNFMINKKLSKVSYQYLDKIYPYKPTNIRAEGFAILYVMIIYKYKFLDDETINISLLNKHKYPQDISYIIKKNELKIKNKKIEKQKIIIYTDSKFWIQTITTWMPNWIEKKTFLYDPNQKRDRPNIDLLLYLNYYYKLLSQNNIDVEFIHVKAHQDQKKNAKLDEYAIGNIFVDKIAGDAINNSDTKFKLYIKTD